MYDPLFIRASDILDTGIYTMQLICSMVSNPYPGVCREKENRMDVLSEVLKVIKLEGAIFYNAEYAAPWSFRAPPSRVVVPYFEQRGGHVIFYHLLTEGGCIARLDDGQQVAVSAGEVVIFPHGDAHIMSSGPGVDPVDYENLLHQVLGQ